MHRCAQQERGVVAPRRRSLRTITAMPPFDAVLLLQEYGDEGLVRDLAQLLVETVPAQAEAVTRAVAAGDGDALRVAAHRLRGSIVPFGASEAVEAARKLELMAARGELS